MKTVLLGAALCALSLCPAAGAADAPQANRIDLAVCLDVSNSMDGLIASAKAKLWDIVNDLAKVQPTPQLRVALYSYGHNSYEAKTGWVRKELDLTADLDALYQKLFALTTRGGNEYVARVCRDAIEQLQWSDDKDALKIVFVCGNEPAAQDPVIKLKEAADKAVARGIVINPIFCGQAQHKDAADWKEFATLAGGGFTSIDQQRGVVAIATPMDKELTELGVRLNATYVVYGGQENLERKLNQAVQDANAAQAGAGVAAARAASKATGLYRNELWDLVDRMKQDPKFDLKSIPEKELSEELRKLKPEEREPFVQRKAQERAGLQKQINDLNARRVLYISNEQKKNASKADRAFDEALRAMLRQQARDKGITIPD